MTSAEPRSPPGRPDLGEFQNAVLEALPVIRDEFVALFDAAPTDEPAVGTIRRLAVYQADRSQAVMFLTSAGYLWDAEIVLRSFYEAIARIVFIGTAPPEERSALEVEFWNLLSSVNDRKRALKVHSSGAMAEHDPRGAAILDVFRDPKIFNVEPTENKARRKAAEQKWSFAEIIAVVSQREIEGVDGLTELVGLLHQYGVSSNLLHADSTAMDLMYDRATREPEERQWVVASQTCRIMTDIISLQCIAAEVFRAMLGLQFRDRDELYCKAWRCMQLVEPINEEFYRTQADFYRRWGRTEFDPPSMGDNAPA